MKPMDRCAWGTDYEIYGISLLKSTTYTDCLVISQPGAPIPTNRMWRR